MSRLDERIENFNRAFDIYKSAVDEFDWNRILSHMALIQSFEVCCELGWKTLKDYLFEGGISVTMPKSVIKEAFNKRVIKNGQVWINMIEARNITSHEYKMEKVHNLLTDISTVYFEELKMLHEWINSENFKEF